MSLDSEDETEVNEKKGRVIDWGGIVNTFDHEVDGDVCRDAPDSIGAKALDAMELMEQGYQSGDIQVFWEACRKQAYSKPFCADVMRGYPCSELFKELLKWGRGSRAYEPLTLAAMNGLIKVLKLFPKEYENLIVLAINHRWTKILEFLLQELSHRPFEWFETLFWKTRNVDCAEAILVVILLKNREYLQHHIRRFQDIVNRAMYYGSVSLLRLMVDHGLVFDLRHYTARDLIRPGNAALLAYILEITPSMDPPFYHDAFRLCLQKRHCLDCAEVLWPLRYQFGELANDHWVHHYILQAENFAATVRFLLSKQLPLNWHKLTTDSITSLDYYNFGTSSKKRGVSKNFFQLRDEFGVNVSEILNTLFLTPEDENEDKWTKQTRLNDRATALWFKRQLDHSGPLDITPKKKKRRLM